MQFQAKFGMKGNEKEKEIFRPIQKLFQIGSKMFFIESLSISAHAGFAKSTKQRIKGSPPHCNTQTFQHIKCSETFNQ